MALNITQTDNKYLNIHNSKNNLDKPLAKDIHDPLPNYSGFCMLIVGASGSGKTTALYSMMSAKPKNGIRQSYRKVFNKVYIVSPTMGGNSIKKDPFKKLPENQIHRELTLEVLNHLEEEIKDNREEDFNSVIIFDDVGSQLRKSQAIDKKITQMIQNRRHNFCSYFILLQRFRDIGTGIRNNLSHLMTYLPKNRPEKEAICNELMPFELKKCHKLFSHIFDNDDNFSFLFVDMSLKTTNKYRFFNKFHLLSLEDLELGIKT